MTFYAAQEQCKKLGGYLARINSIREQVFLEDYLNQELQQEGKPATLIYISFNMHARIVHCKLVQSL